jgi:hypothetical protein
VVANHGPLIMATNFWKLPAAAAGKFLVSVKVGAFRLLVPASQTAVVSQFATAKGVAVSRGPWPAQRLADGVEIFFDDATSDSFALHLTVESFDRLPLDSDAAGAWILTVWTKPRREGLPPHQALERPCRYRQVAKIPDLRPWEQP